MHDLLKAEGIKHVYNNALEFTHDWNAQWLAPTLEALMGLTEDPVAVHKENVRAAKELKARIEPDKKPPDDYRYITKGEIDIVADATKSRIEFWFDVQVEHLGLLNYKLD